MYVYVCFAERAAGYCYVMWMYWNPMYWCDKTKKKKKKKKPDGIPVSECICITVIEAEPQWPAVAAVECTNEYDHIKVVNTCVCKRTPKSTLKLLLYWANRLVQAFIVCPTHRLNEYKCCRSHHLYLTKNALRPFSIWMSAHTRSSTPSGE